MKESLERKLSRKYKFLRPSQPRSIVKDNIKIMTHKLTKKETVEKVMLGKYKEPKFIADLMVFGMECDDGWYELLDTLCDDIQNHINDTGVPFKASQIKEKYGGLRFYYDGGDEMIMGMVSLAEEMSYHICENCGNKGELSVRHDWFKTLCSDCRKTEEFKGYKVKK
jgi:hypothetical protein